MALSVGNFFRKYILKNLPFKLVSLAIAILLWWAVGRDQPIEVPMTVPLEFQNAPANLEINSNYPFEARVTLRGPERLMQDLRPSEVHAVLDLQGATPGESTFDLTRSEIHVPREVKVVQIVPSQFHISFDRSVTRTVPVQPRVIGTLLSGYGITDVNADPAMITIVGPERRVNDIQTAMTDPVDATGVVGKATFTTHVYVADPLVRVQTPGAIHVTVNTAKTSAERASLKRTAMWHSQRAVRATREDCDNYSGQMEFGAWPASIRSTRRQWSPLGELWASGWRPATKHARVDYRPGHARVECLDQRSAGSGTGIGEGAAWSARELSRRRASPT